MGMNAIMHWLVVNLKNMSAAVSVLVGPEGKVIGLKHPPLVLVVTLHLK